MITSKEFATSSDTVMDPEEMFAVIPHLLWSSHDNKFSRNNALIFCSAIELHRLKLLHPFKHHDFLCRAIDDATQKMVEFLAPGWARNGFEFDKNTNLYLQSADAGCRGVLVPVPYCYWRWGQEGLAFYPMQIAPPENDWQLRLPKTMYEMYKIFVKKYKPFVYYDLCGNHASRLRNAL